MAGSLIPLVDNNFNPQVKRSFYLVQGTSTIADGLIVEGIVLLDPTTGLPTSGGGGGGGGNVVVTNTTGDPVPTDPRQLTATTDVVGVNPQGLEFSQNITPTAATIMNWGTIPTSTPSLILKSKTLFFVATTGFTWAGNNDVTLQLYVSRQAIAASTGALSVASGAILVGPTFKFVSAGTSFPINSTIVISPTGAATPTIAYATSGAWPELNNYWPYIGIQMVSSVAAPTAGAATFYLEGNGF